MKTRKLRRQAISTFAVKTYSFAVLIVCHLLPINTGASNSQGDAELGSSSQAPAYFNTQFYNFNTSYIPSFITLILAYSVLKIQGHHIIRNVLHYISGTRYM